MLNPFLYGAPVSDENFIGRQKELRRILGRIQKGECTAIIGDPHIGKSSLLSRLEQNEITDSLQKDDSEQWHPFFIDTQLLGTEFTPAQFWEHALTPIREQIEQDTISQSVKDHYPLCWDNNFGNITLERFFARLKKEDYHFVLLIDEFDVLLHHPVLNSAEFYGGLRALASRSDDAFAIVIASRTSLSGLNAMTQEFNPTGSPFFNIFAEIELSPMTKKDVANLLAMGKERFAPHDKNAIQTLGGRHPFLLQASAAAMWDAYDEEELEDVVNRLPYVTKRLYRELDQFFSDTWRIWTPELRKAFTCVGIAHQAHILKDQFRLSSVIKNLNEFSPELSDLEEKGMIAASELHECGYRVEPEIMLTWLADELIKAGRTENSFGTWLQKHQMDGAFLTKSEKEEFKQAVNGAAGVLKKGTMSFIDSFAKALGETLTKGIVPGS